MSEYQYYEWQAIGRLLTRAEQAAVGRLSSHIDVSSSQAVVTYNWSDFKHDPVQVLLKYFDAYFYFANWGSLRLMFRFPKGMLDESKIAPYLDGECVSFETIGDHQVLDIYFDSEDGGWLEETDLQLSAFIPLRAALLNGDYRLLYLAWLNQMTYLCESEYVVGEENVEDVIEPPVPPGLKDLTPELENFIHALGMNPFIVQAAAEASQDLRPGHSIDYRDLVTRLSRSECEDFLARVANEDDLVGMALRKRLNDFIPQSNSTELAGNRSLQELFDRAQHLKEANKRQLAEAARRKHVMEMTALAKREAQAWREVDLLLETGQKIASVYDQATAQLEKLQQLSQFQNNKDKFLTHVRQLAQKYSARSSLIIRWRDKGWI
jgi:hypothetical protein